MVVAFCTYDHYFSPTLMFPRDSSVTCATAPGAVATQACLDRIRAQEQAMCLLCGPANPNGLKVKFKVQPDGSVAAILDCLAKSLWRRRPNS